MEEKQKYQYWMRSIPGIGNKKLKKLVEYCGGAKEVYGLRKEQLEKISGISAKDADAICQSRHCFDLEKEMELFQAAKVSMITIEEESFPERLTYLSDCPYALFYKGELPLSKERTVAIVGARMCSSYGRAAALELGERLAECGAAVISGMAAGIDSFGHWGAIKGGGRTYAVLGCGTDICYPRGGRELYEQIQAAGGLLSEYLPGTPPAAAQFPARNRLISGLADVIILIEAKEKSGSLITADCALEQGRDVYALPGRITDALSAGCNRLIAQGAGIFLSVEDVLMELSLSAVYAKEKKSAPRSTLKSGNCEIFDNLHKFSLEKDELLVYGCLGLLPTGFEELLEKTGLDIQALSQILAALLQKHRIEEVFKNHYKIITE